MKYPNIKPDQGEQPDINQRRYPEDNIEVAGNTDQQTEEARRHTPDKTTNKGNSGSSGTK